MEDRGKFESVRTVGVRGCRYYLNKVLKENLKGGNTYDFSCHWLTGMKLTPSPLKAPEVEEVYSHDEDDGDYPSFFKKVLKENVNGGVIHEFSYSWLTGSELRPVAFMPKRGERFNFLLPMNDYRRLFTLVAWENLKGGVLHEFSYSQLGGAKLTPLIPEKRPSAVRDDRVIGILKHPLVCHHIVRRSGFLHSKIVLQPFRLHPYGKCEGDHSH